MRDLDGQTEPAGETDHFFGNYIPLDDCFLTPLDAEVKDGPLHTVTMPESPHRPRMPDQEAGGVTELARKV
jgi:hypothetical protein